MPPLSLKKTHTLEELAPHSKFWRQIHVFLTYFEQLRQFSNIWLQNGKKCRKIQISGQKFKINKFLLPLKTSWFLREKLIFERALPDRRSPRKKEKVTHLNIYADLWWCESVVAIYGVIPSVGLLCRSFLWVFFYFHTSHLWVSLEGLFRRSLFCCLFLILYTSLSRVCVLGVFSLVHMLLF